MWPFSRKTTKYDPEKDLPDLTGKVAIVTGGKSVSLPSLSTSPRIHVLLRLH